MLNNFLDLIVDIIGGEQYVTVFTALASVIAAGIIAFATWKYTNYSKINLEELKTQNKYLKEVEEKKYKLERKALCKKLSYEITQNEVILNDLQNFLNSKISKNLLKTKEHFKKNSYKYLLGDNIYKRYTERNIDFVDDEVFENIFTLYSNINHIKRDTDLIEIVNKGTLDIHLNELNRLTKDSLDRIEFLYDLFKEETGYNHKKSKYYKKQKEIIKFFKGLEILE